MADTPTIRAARRFLSIATEGEPPSVEQLAHALDDLAIAYHHAPEGSDSEEDLDPPSADCIERYATLDARFPQLGSYAVADPSEPAGDKPDVNDAIVDLADICGDLEEVIWRFETVGPDEANFYFKLLYRIHWGRHMRDLASYLHALCRRDWP